MHYFNWGSNIWVYDEVYWEQNLASTPVLASLAGAGCCKGTHERKLFWDALSWKRAFEGSEVRRGVNQASQQKVNIVNIWKPARLSLCWFNANLKLLISALQFCSLLSLAATFKDGLWREQSMARRRTNSWQTLKYLWYLPHSLCWDNRMAISNCSL